MNWLPKLIKFAGDPHQRFHLFTCGIGLFAVALLCLYAGVAAGISASIAIWLTRVGSLLLVLSVTLSLYCYFSLLVARLLHFWQD